MYTPAAGAVLAAGAQTLSVTFTPTDSADYSAATLTVFLTVNKAPLTVTPNNASRLYGVANPTFTGFDHRAGCRGHHHSNLCVSGQPYNDRWGLLQWSECNCGDVV